MYVQRLKPSDALRSLSLCLQDVKVHVGFRSRPIHHRHRQFGEQPFEMEKPVPLEAEYPSTHHPMKKFVVPDEEFLRPWSDTSATSSANSLGKNHDGEDYYYKDDTSVDQGLRWLFLPL